MTLLPPPTLHKPHQRHTTLAPAGGARMIGNEVAKGLRILWSHKATLLPQLLVLALMYLMFQLILGGGSLVTELLPKTLFAFSIYVISYITLLKMVAGLMEEVNAGTFEQTHLSPLRTWQLSLGRLGAVLIEGVAFALVIGTVFALALGIDIPPRPAAVVPLLLTLADIAGFGLLLAGLALLVNSIGAIVHVINSVVVMLNGSVVPIAVFPVGLEIVAKLVPTTLGIDATSTALFDEGPTGSGVALAALHAAVMLAVGWSVYHAAIGKGRKDGRLGP